MPASAHCSRCGHYVWLTPDGTCPRGHPRSSLRDVCDSGRLPAPAHASHASRLAALDAAGTAAAPTGPPSASADGDWRRELLAAGVIPHSLVVNPATTDCLGRRLSAFAIDFAIINLAGALLFLTAMLAGLVSFGMLSLASAGLSIGVQLGLFALVFVYFAAFETLFAKTPGMAIVGLRVLSTDGEDPSAGQAAARAIGLMVELSLLGIPSLISIRGSRLHQRWGDKWAGTAVVRS